MSISQTINVATLGQVVTNAGGIGFPIQTPTGTLGAISTLNVDELNTNTGVRSVLVNVPCSVYQGSLNSASFSFRTFRSYVYLDAEGRAPFGFVNTEEQLFDIQSLALENGLRVDDYVIFNASDPLSDYEIGDAALFIGPISDPPAENAWVRYIGGITSGPITPSSPVASTGVKVDGKLVANDTAVPNNQGTWNIMPKTEK